MFKTRFEALKLLKKSKEISAQSKNKIFITNDKTISQLQYEKQIRTELKNRLDNGENNLKIKYFNSIPKIIEVFNIDTDNENINSEDEDSKSDGSYKSSHSILSNKLVISTSHSSKHTEVTKSQTNENTSAKKVQKYSKQVTPTINTKLTNLKKNKNEKKGKTIHLRMLFIRTTQKKIIEVKIATKPLVNVDVFHVPLEFKVELEYVHKKFEKIMFYNYKKANYESIFNKLSLIDWENSINNTDININVHKFYDILNKIISEDVPKTLLIKDKFPKFFSKKLKRLIKIKKIYQKKYKATKKFYHYQKFNKYRKYCKYIYNLEYNKFIENIENEVKTNQIPYWSYIGNKKKNEIPNDMFYNNKIYENENEIGNTFADFFHSTYSSSKLNSILQNLKTK